MRTKIRPLILLLLGFFVLAACQNPSKSIPKKILFIGNSYTAQVKNRLTTMLENSPYKETTFEFITKGGATLKRHLNDTKVLDKIIAEKWDYVVLQDQSQVPALPEEAESFHNSVDTFTQHIREAGAQPLLYMTWGRRDGDQRNKEIFPDYQTMQNKLTEAYLSAAKRNHIAIAKVGEAWSIVRQHNPSLGNELYKKDGSHPSDKGAYVVCSILFRSLFNDSLNTIHYENVLQKDEWEIIKQAVLNTDSQTPTSK